MTWIIENWYLLLAGICVVIVGAIAIKEFFNKPTDEQIRNIKEWLLYAVTEAEAILGGKTGQLKLRMVYDMAIEKFSWVSFISFETFSGWVDEALEQMRHLLETNEAIKSIVGGD